MIPASLYTHTMRYCPTYTGCGGDPWRRCRGHRVPRPPALPADRFEMRAPRRRPQRMDQARRMDVYAAQKPGRMTARQARRLRHKLPGTPSWPA